ATIIGIYYLAFFAANNLVGWIGALCWSVHHRLSNRHFSFQHLRCQSSDLFRRALNRATIFARQIAAATVADLVDLLVRCPRTVTFRSPTHLATRGEGDLLRAPGCSTAILAVGPTGILPVESSANQRRRDQTAISLSP